mmetsp:Transcript_45256/g.96233  ORF Transcript_45256/g.96233 Transcript_45256/m.96233 type:complete len:244 (-) Transcript_45256:99-830(-)|eukprot:CAMPEP_0183339378 /NCGR_PEP_ID=MMETSP0164_2-20130417/6322_1 /TAXON_ID=221442 /ORGANISM="Coccolithus pelagicus ssp braarudi, Strain PLY182g" /LENGTH=243 /DNA_ID=CAMNT_0025509359 /DNA_START=40 /DNA_END=771 /DNA_ORIENTATION=-
MSPWLKFSRALLIGWAAHVTLGCPGTNALFGIHASCQLKLSFQQSCERVRNEIDARIKGEHGWVDPHFQGTYSLADTPMTLSLLTGERKSGLKDGQGGGRFTDKFDFTFNEAEGDGCLVAACSESQGFSISDFSTNYCNLHNLFCGDEQGCPSVLEPALHFVEDFVSGRCLVEHDMQRCVSTNAQSELREDISAPALRAGTAGSGGVFLLLGASVAIIALVAATRGFLSYHKVRVAPDSYNQL